MARSAPATQTDTRPLSRTVTVIYAAAVLGVGRSSAYRLIREGTFPLPTIRIGRRVVVPRDALDRLLEDGAPDAA